MPSSLFKEHFNLILYHWKISMSLTVSFNLEISNNYKRMMNCHVPTTNLNNYLQFVNLVSFILHTHFPFLRCFKANLRFHFISLSILQCIH